MRHLTKLLSLSALAIIAVMAMSASAAQAEWRLLLNGKKVTELHLRLSGLPGYIKAENGLKIACSGGEGLAIVKSEGATPKGTASATFTGCKWESNPQCIINDGGEGRINASGAGEVTMLPGEEHYVVTATSGAGEPFAIIYSEGAKCTLPEEEEVTGTGSALILEALKDATLKLAHLKADNLKLGNSKVSELVGEVHISDFLDATATIGIHLCNLPGNPPC